MPRRVNKRGWYVLVSIAADDGAYCVDLFEQPAGDFGFQQFRSDVEDGGAWTPVGAASRGFGSATEAGAGAIAAVRWLTEQPRAKASFEDWLGIN